MLMFRDSSPKHFERIYMQYYILSALDAKYSYYNMVRIFHLNKSALIFLLQILNNDQLLRNFYSIYQLQPNYYEWLQ